MALVRKAGFTSAIATNPDDTAAGNLTPARYNLAHVLTGAVSGGIPYGTSTTTEDYSAILAQYGVVVGGGAGEAPATSASLTYSDTASINSGPLLTVGSGATSATALKAGNYASGYGGIWAGAITPSANNYALVAGASLTEINAPSGGSVVLGVNNGTTATVTNAALVMANTLPIQFTIGGATNIGLSGVSASVLGVGTGAAASVAGSLSLTNLTTIATSSTGTSAILDGSNVLRPLTSSERFKTNVQEWEPSDKEIAAFLALPAISFDYQDHPARIEPEQFIPAKVEKQPSPILDAKGDAPLIDVIVEPAKTIPAWEIEPAREGVKNVLGFSAEKIDKAGLTQLLNYDAQGLPYSLREHGLIAMLFAIIKRQEARIAALEAA